MTPAARLSDGSPLDLDAFLETLWEACRQAAGQGNPEVVHRALVAEGLARARAHGWNDVYTMTKSLGEQFLVRDRGPVPLAIVRPSIIESGLREPQPGWLDGLRMMEPVLVAYARGQLTHFPANPNSPLDIVPVDLVVNGTVAAAAELLRQHGLSVYHAATGDVAPVRFGQTAQYIHEYFTRHPLRDRQGAPVRVKPWRYPSPAAFQRRYRSLRLTPLRAVRDVLGKPSLAPGAAESSSGSSGRV